MQMTTGETAKNKRTPRKRVTFRYEAGPEDTVELAGNFNNWTPRPLTLKDDAYTATLLLTAGRYEYKFVVNGVWKTDPAAAELVPNEHGTLNSVIRV